MKFKLIEKIFQILRLTRFEKFILNTGSVFTRRISGMTLSFIWIFAITNFFGAKAYGLISISQVVISFLGVFFGLGIDTFLVKFGSMKEHFFDGNINSNFLKKSIHIFLISSIACGATFFLFKEFLAHKVLGNPELSIFFKWISLLSVLYLSHKTFISFLTVQGKFKAYGNYQFLLPNIGVLISVFLVYHFEWPLYFIIIGYICSYGFLGIVQLISLSQITTHYIHQISYKEILKISTPMMISSSFLFISSWTDILMLGAMVSEEKVGIYNAAFKLGALVLIIIAAVNSVLSPKISTFYDNNDIPSLKREVIKATKVITYLSLPIVLVLIIFRRQILGLFGEEFISGEVVLIIISLGMFFNAMSGSVGQILNMTSFQKEFRNFTIISAVINVVLNYFLIRQFDILGAALASLISNIIINLMCILLVKQKFNFYACFKL